MEIQLQKDQSILKFSKHFLIKGWGLDQQDQANSINIDFPKDWALFDGYLKAMGNHHNHRIGQIEYDLECYLGETSSKSSQYSFLMKAVVERQNLVIQLIKNSQIVRVWSFAFLTQEPSSDLIQISFFLSVTDCIKLNLITTKSKLPKI